MGSIIVDTKNKIIKASNYTRLPIRKGEKVVGFWLLKMDMRYDLPCL